jgi:hypothetical protein
VHPDSVTGGSLKRNHFPRTGGTKPITRYCIKAKAKAKLKKFTVACHNCWRRENIISLPMATA